MKRLLLLIFLVAIWLCVPSVSHGQNFYQTNFPLTENPISESGKWTNGGTTGIKWGNVQTTAGKVFGTVLSSGCPGTPTNCNDSTAVLTGVWGASQMAEGVVFNNVTTGCCKEVEVRLRTTITANSITGYEINCSTVAGTPYIQIVRWNGALGNFTALNSSGATYCQTGDVLTGTMVGTTINAYKNGTLIVSASDATYASGSPGVGFFNNVDTVQSGFGFSSFYASDNFAATCGATDTQNAITAAPNGATVLIPAGSCSWNLATVTVAKPLTLYGTGQGVTVIDLGTTQNVLNLQKQTTGPIWVRNLTYNLTNNKPGSGQKAVHVTGPWPTGKPVILYGITVNLNNADLVHMDGNGGLIVSHSTFNGTIVGDGLLHHKTQTYADYVNSWQTADSMGTNDTTGFYNTYVEDNTFNGVGVVDCDDGCRFVMRHNIMNDSPGYNSHGDDTSPVGTRHFEIYNNQFLFPDKTCTNGNNSLSNLNWQIWVRGGTGVVYNNQFAKLTSSCWGTKNQVAMNIRGAEDALAYQPPTYTVRATCGTTTYPVANQLGQNYNGSAFFTDPIYFWNNTSIDGLNGNGYYVQGSTGWNWGNPCVFTWGTFFQWGRDAIDGALSTGAGYTGGLVEIQQAGATPKPGYTAYPYPHPLLGVVGCSGASPNWTTSPDQPSVNTCITNASSGDTINILAGTATWATGVSVPSNKTLNIKGAGSGRIIAYDNGTEVLTIATGTLTVNIAGYSPGFSSSSITAGQTLRVFENNNRDNWMQGTVSSIVGNVLTMNITSTNGGGSTHRWLIATMPSTVIINNSSATLFSLSESTTGNTSISGIQFSVGASHSCCAAYDINVSYTAGGQAVLIHDNWMQQDQGAFGQIEFNTNRGVIWNNSFDGSSYNNSQMVTVGVFRTKIDNPQAGQNAWLSTSFWGTADTTGQNNLYVENNDFHAFQGLSDNDDNARTVFRYNVVDHATFGTHGNDSSPYGQRYFEYYNNTGNFNCYGDGTTFNMANSWIGLMRGGTFIAHDNNLPALQPCQDYSKPDINIIEFDLNYGGGQNPSNGCWGANMGGGGALYHAPRQAGFGRVTGTGLDGKGRSTDETTYVGDSEPIYIWNNNRTFAVGYSNYTGTTCTNPDVTANYVVVGRDIFFSAKPAYTPYTYPHPLTQSSAGVVNTPTFSPPAAIYTAGQSVTLATATASATICFTTDGTTPTTNGAGTCTHGTTYTTPVSITTTNTILKAIGTKSGLTDSALASGTYVLQGTAPSFSPGAGTYSSTQNVTISQAQSQAICYTTDGSTPTSNGAGTCSHGSLYSTPVTVSTSLTLKAIGMANGFTDSLVGSAVYTIKPVAATPTSSPAAGTYSSTQSVTLSTTSGGAIICYTTDGTNPKTDGATGCTTGTLYSGAISVASTTTIRAIAGGTGFTDSSILSATYTINPVAIAPSLAPGTGTYTSTQSVSMSSGSVGAIICYTVNGTTPATNGGAGCTTGSLYSTPISVSSAETVKAIAGGTGYTDSLVTSATYSFQAAAPTASLAAGTYTGTQTTTLSTSSGSVICYTINGTTPATNGAAGCTTGTLYSGAISITTSETLKAIAGGTGFVDSSVSSFAYVINKIAATPTFSPAAGTYNGTQLVTISTTSTGAVICYTTNGTTPATNGTTGCTTGSLYSSPVSVASSLTVKAIAGGTGYTDSAVGSAAYTIQTPVATPTFSPVAGTYTATQNVTISTVTAGATICYTTDNSTPTTNGAGTCTHGTTYSTPVAVSATLTIQAIATKSGSVDSAIASANYIITPVAATPTASPVPGTYSSTQSVTLSTASSGAIICYTTNGTTPKTNGTTGCTTGTKYTGAISVSTTQTILAVAGGTGFTDSGVLTALYTINAVAVAPSITPGTGTYASTQTVSMSTPSSGAVICYTTNGSTPSTNGASGCTAGSLYSTAITVSSAETVKAIAGGTGYTDSLVTTAVYSFSAATPTASLPSGTYTGTQSTTLSTTAGGVICYTVNGTTPQTNGGAGCTTGTLYTTAISIATSETLKAVAGGTGYVDSAVASFTYVINKIAATPTFSPAAGTYNGTQTVTISTTSTGAVICYTTNGTTPATNGTTGCTTGTLYSAAITVSSTQTVKAIAGGTGYTDSAVGSAAYTIQTPVATPTFSPVSGTYNGTQNVTISTATAGATICYTTDGSTPTTNGSGTCTSGTTYTTPVSVTLSLTIKAVATKSGSVDSALASSAYIITTTAATPTASPAAGTYATTQSVTLSTTSSGAVICYTTDLSTPKTDGISACTAGTKYTGAISVASSQTIKAVAGGTGFVDSGILSAAYVIDTVANAPAITPGTGTYTSTQSVTISTTSTSAVICYTTDGSTPATNGTNGCTTGSLFSSAISVSSAETIKAIAGGTGYTDSLVTSATYSFQAAAPVASPGAGAYNGTKSVTLTTSVGGVICYTTNGSTPQTNGSTGCTAGTKYTGAISVASSETIKAVAGGTGYVDSTVASFVYVINTAPPPAPSITSFLSARLETREHDHLYFRHKENYESHSEIVLVDLREERSQCGASGSLSHLPESGALQSHNDGRTDCGCQDRRLVGDRAGRHRLGSEDHEVVTGWRNANPVIAA